MAGEDQRDQAEQHGFPRKIAAQVAEDFGKYHLAGNQRRKIQQTQTGGEMFCGGVPADGAEDGGKEGDGPFGL